MKQVFINLINNSAYACGERGTIWLRTRHDGTLSAVEISIADDGIGIPSQHLKNIFDPFFTTKKDGTGLGLSVSYGIVRDHGGQISVVSEQGQGATFTIKLPLAEPGECE
jgi:two-component system NtrC family sensor kinase